MKPAHGGDSPMSADWAIDQLGRDAAESALAFIEKDGGTGWLVRRWHNGRRGWFVVHCDTYEAAYSAPDQPDDGVRPVQRLLRTAVRKLRELEDEGFEVNGYALYRDGERVLIDYCGFVSRVHAGSFPLSLKAPRAGFARRIYIAGPMTGMPELNFPAFRATAATLRGMGIDAVNPAEINADPSAAWTDCLRKDIAQLLTCEAILLLPGWEESRRARLELHVAKKLGMAIYYSLSEMRELAPLPPNAPVERRAESPSDSNDLLGLPEKGD